jgi:hypothetical protein
VPKSQWRIEHVAKKPRGGRVITKRAGKHLLRVWYANPGTGSGRAALLQILHPKRENPFCIFGERCKRNPEELVILGLANPHRNPTPTAEQARAADLYSEFHGEDPRKILAVQRSAAMRLDYTALGDLEYIVFQPDGEKEARKIDFTKADGVKLAANAEGTQLYIIDGNQDLSGCLDDFPVDLEKDFLDLGQVVRVSYFTRKKFDGFKPVAYYHDLGEESGVRPRGGYDKLKKEIFIFGGEYKIKPEGIVN